MSKSTKTKSESKEASTSPDSSPLEQENTENVTTCDESIEGVIGCSLEELEDRAVKFVATLLSMKPEYSAAFLLMSVAVYSLLQDALKNDVDGFIGAFNEELEGNFMFPLTSMLMVKLNTGLVN